MKLEQEIKKSTWPPSWQILFSTEKEMGKLDCIVKDLEKKGVRRGEWGMYRLDDETRDAWSITYDEGKRTCMIELTYDPDISVFRFYKSDTKGVTKETLTDQDTAIQRFKDEIKSIYGGE